MATDAQLEPLPADLRRWSRAKLGLPPEKSAASDRRAVLAQLGELDFILPPDWDGALRLAGFSRWEDVNSPIFLPARRAWEESLRAEVEEFARQFFSMPSDARTARFHDLLSRCGGAPAIAARLEALRPALGLPCELPAECSPDVRELLEQARRLFVLPRQERAGRRCVFLGRCRDEPIQWREAAVFAQRNHARDAALEPALFRELTAPANREQSIAKLARRRQRAARRAPRQRADQSASRGNWAERWGVLIAICGFLVSGTLGFLRTSGNDPRSGNHVAPRPQLEIERLNREMNERLRRGEPVGEAIRRLYGLPPEPRREAKPASSSSTSTQGSPYEPSDQPRLNDQPSSPESPEHPPP